MLLLTQIWKMQVLPRSINKCYGYIYRLIWSVYACIWNYAVKDADMLVFVTPHQFIDGICQRLEGKIKEHATAISLIKGMEVKADGPRMISSVISDDLDIDCCVLMGANIANEVVTSTFPSFPKVPKTSIPIATYNCRICRLPWRSLVKPLLDIDRTKKLQSSGSNSLPHRTSWSQL